jgi:hypothetical protein
MTYHVPMCLVCDTREVQIVVNSVGSGYCSPECEQVANEQEEEKEAYDARLAKLDAEDCEYDESMDGDFDSGMASAGFGTDEDYGYYGGEDY